MDRGQWHQGFQLRQNLLVHEDWFGEVLPTVHDPMTDRQQLCALVMLSQPRANDRDGAAMMKDIIGVLRAIDKRLSSGVLHRKPRLSPNPFHLPGGLGDRLIRLVLIEKSELEARRAGIGDKDKRSHIDCSFSAISQRLCSRGSETSSVPD
jgi:hypothetical protein